MKFVLFSVSENRENGLGDEGADGGNASRIFGLEPPLLSEGQTRNLSVITTGYNNYVCLSSGKPVISALVMCG